MCSEVLYSEGTSMPEVSLWSSNYSIEPVATIQLLSWPLQALFSLAVYVIQ